MTKTPAQILREAKQLINKPDKLCKFGYAENARGEDVKATAKSACRFCVRGAIMRVVKMSDPETTNRLPAVRLLEAAKPERHESLEQWNNMSTHPALMRGFDRAIALAEQEQLNAH